jgi:hypothetical protein
MPRIWTEEQKQRMRETQKARVARERQQSKPVPAPCVPPNVIVNCSAKFDIAALGQLSHQQLAALMGGIATVLGVGGGAAKVK